MDEGIISKKKLNENYNNNSISKAGTKASVKNNTIKDEFKIQHYNDDENICEDDDFEKMLEKEIEQNCTINIYVDKLEIEEIPDSKLLSLDKQEIIDNKNYQIQKLKAYIVSLEKEKEDLINNFKNTTNALLNKIKEIEFNDIGARPQTAKIVEDIIQKDFQKYSIKHNLVSFSDMNSSLNSSKFFENKLKNKGQYLGQASQINSNNRKINVMSFENNKEYKLERCPQCRKEFPAEKFIQHSLDCLRNNFTCKICKEVIPEILKKEHILKWRSNEVK